MKLRTEVAQGSNKNWPWVWRVRSTESEVGREFLAVGAAATEQEAIEKANKVLRACVELWP